MNDDEEEGFVGSVHQNWNEPDAADREALTALFNSPAHAPMDTHSRLDGSCVNCPVPLYELSPPEIIDAILAAGFSRGFSVIRVTKGSSQTDQRSFDDFYDADYVSHDVRDVASRQVARRYWVAGQAARSSN